MSGLEGVPATEQRRALRLLELMPPGSEQLPLGDLFDLLGLPLEELDLGREIGLPEGFGRPGWGGGIYFDPDVIRKLRCMWFERSFDPGPGCTLGLHFEKAPDLAELQPDAFRPEFGPVYYRGRTDGTARVLVVGQDPGTDEQLARRCFVGESGQRVQGLLRKLGVTRSYLMVNTLHLGIKVNASDLKTLSLSDPVLSWRNDLFDLAVATNALEAIIAVGSMARDAVDAWGPPSTVARVNVVHPSAINFDIDVFSSWNDALTDLGAALTPDPGVTPDLTPYTGDDFAADVVDDIPRRDLPYGTPDWFGRGGQTKSHRNGPDELVWEHVP